MKIKNIHTEEVLELVTHENVSSFPKDIKVYILSDGFTLECRTVVGTLHHCRGVNYD